MTPESTAKEKALEHMHHCARCQIVLITTLQPDQLCDEGRRLVRQLVQAHNASVKAARNGGN